MGKTPFENLLNPYLSMSQMNFATSNETFRKLLGNGLTYAIPRFQRDYSWTQTEWEDLWEDIRNLFEEEAEPAHYMGYLVLQSSDNKQHDIIDGQQRMTTLSILVLAAISVLEGLAEKGDEASSVQDKLRAEQLRNSYIGYLDPVTLVPRSKLTLNRHNNDFYQTYMVPLEKMPQRGIRASEHSLRKAFDWFVREIRQSYGQSGEKTAGLIDGIVDKLFFTVITVTDELNAFKVFETLNARGVRLSSTDLLKNYLFVLVSQGDHHSQQIESMESLWERVVGTLGAESLPEFLRVFWNSRHPHVRKADLFKTIRQQISDKEGAFALIRNLDAAAHIYVALRNPHDELWAPDERKYLEQLQLFGVRQPLPMLMIAFEKFQLENRQALGKIFRAVSILSFRYNVICALPAREQERVYNKVANAIADDYALTKSDVVNCLEEIYPNDQIFETSFQEKELTTTSSRNKKVVRFILGKIEESLGGTMPDLETSQSTIEHICPQNSEPADWDEETSKLVYRLGNMVLLSAAENKAIENKDYATKRPVLKGSRFATTRYVGDNYDSWTREKISSFQRFLAKKAKTIWRLDFD